jgi:hypothetical protein
MYVTASVCPIHCNGGAGHDNNFPLYILMVLVNHVLNMVDKGDLRVGRVLLKCSEFS